MATARVSQGSMQSCPIETRRLQNLMRGIEDTKSPSKCSHNKKIIGTLPNNRQPWQKCKSPLRGAAVINSTFHFSYTKFGFAADCNRSHKICLLAVDAVGSSFTYQSHWLLSLKLAPISVYTKIRFSRLYSNILFLFIRVFFIFLFM